jgi:hypothetical protein
MQTKAAIKCSKLASETKYRMAKANTPSIMISLIPFPPEVAPHPASRGAAVYEEL